MVNWLWSNPMHIELVFAYALAVLASTVAMVGWGLLSIAIHPESLGSYMKRIGKLALSCLFNHNNQNSD